MNFLYENRHKLKQELPAIITLSVLQIISSFTYPPYHRLGPVYGTIVASVVSLFSIMILVVAFSTAEDYAYYINFDSYDDLGDRQYSEFFKKLTQYTILVMFNVVMYGYWRFNILNMPTMYYLLLHFQFLLGLILFYRAANRSPKSTKNSE
ncbi:hypothetical protein Noda2021_03500 [Candidatus Dependentiae bacterium Noda2021]|nr:hypothetical protein Noda2021_03500 [Candidatus Dependentiae bacterium Noda2021]